MSDFPVIKAVLEAVKNDEASFLKVTNEQLEAARAEYEAMKEGVGREGEKKESGMTCPGCGWNLATSDGYCLDCTPESDEFAGHPSCPHCFTIDPGEDYCASCGERL